MTGEPCGATITGNHKLAVKPEEACEKDGITRVLYYFIDTSLLVALFWMKGQRLISCLPIIIVAAMPNGISMPLNSRVEFLSRLIWALE